MAKKTTMANNSCCPVEEAARTCPFLRELPQIPLEWFWLQQFAAAQSTQMEDTESPTEASEVTATEDQAAPATTGNTPSEENQEPTGGEELDYNAEVSNFLNQLVGIILELEAEPAQRKRIPCRKKQTPEATATEEPAAPTTDDDTPSEENQEPTGGTEVDCRDEARNWFKMGQVVGIIVMSESAEEQETEDQTPEIPKDAIGVCCAEREMPSQQQPYPEKFNNPPQGTYSFVNADKIKELMDDSIEELQNATHADQVRGKVRDICDLALAMGADELVDLCEEFAVGDATRAQILAAARAALGEYYVEHRRFILKKGFEGFCQEYLTTFKELAEIIG